MIAGRYRLDAPLGRGAMGEIWSAEHVRLKSHVAVKFLDPSIDHDGFAELAGCTLAVMHSHAA